MAATDGSSVGSEGVVVRRTSLATRTGRAYLLVTPLLLLTHVIFLYAQLSGTELDCPGSDTGKGPGSCPNHFPSNAGLAEGEREREKAREEKLTYRPMRHLHMTHCL